MSGSRRNSAIGRQRVVKTTLPGHDGEFELLEVEGVTSTTMTLQLGEDPPRRDDVEGLVVERSRIARSLSGGRRGNHDPAARLEDMDADSVDADVIVHPGFPIMKPKDRTTRWGMMRAFNDWLADYCSYAPRAPDRRRRDSGVGHRSCRR